MSDTYPPKFVKEFKKIFPKCADLHALLDGNDMSMEAQNRISEQVSSLHLYTMLDEEIVRLFKVGEERKVLAFARKQVKTAKAIRTLSSLWQPPPSYKS